MVVLEGIMMLDWRLVFFVRLSASALSMVGVFEQGYFGCLTVVVIFVRVVN
jgi:hypothetical protein